jgi:hypothetical protein
MDNNQKIKTKRTDKNLQDDWLPDQTRSDEATSDELPEYGGDLKERENIRPEKKS